MKKMYIAAAAACIVTAFTITAWADGWTRNATGQWTYVSGGSLAYNTWKTGSDGSYYYLGSDGTMAVNSFVEDRYVDSDGKMVTAAWRQINGRWYYFDSSGKITTNKMRQINDACYYFGDDGSMVTGWVNSSEDWYYCDASNGGRMVTAAWKKLQPAEGMDATSRSTSDPLAENDGTYWFYFSTTGKAVRAGGSSEYKEYVIDANRYAFDSDGRMMTGWVKLSTTTPAIYGYKYFNDTAAIGSLGAAHVGWLSIYPPDETGYSSEVEWYYFDTIGRPVCGTDVSDSDNDETLEAKFKRLQKNGVTKTFLFNEYGNPVYGLRKVSRSNGTVTSMYFGTKSQSCLQLGSTSITDAEGNKYSYYFDASGYGYSGVKNNRLYYMGMLQKAVDDTYAYYTVNGTTYLVNKSGTLVKNHNKTKSSSDVEYRSDSMGRRDGGQGSVSELLEPVFQTSYY